MIPGLGLLQKIGLGVGLLALVAVGAFWKGHSVGVSKGALAALKAENAQLIERSETDAEVDSLDRYGLCVDLLGKLPDCDEFR